MTDAELNDHLRRARILIARLWHTAVKRDLDEVIRLLNILEAEQIRRGRRR